MPATQSSQITPTMRSRSSRASVTGVRRAHHPRRYAAPGLGDRWAALQTVLYSPRVLVEQHRAKQLKARRWVVKHVEDRIAVADREGDLRLSVRQRSVQL